MTDSNTFQRKDPGDDLRAALQHAAGLLQKSPDLAELKAREILKDSPTVDPAQHILAVSCRLQGRPDEALAILEPLAGRAANSPAIQYDLGLCLAAVGRGQDAIVALQKTVALDPKNAGAWHALGDQLSAAGDTKGSRKAYEKQIETSDGDPDLAKAADYLRDGEIAKAEKLAREIVKKSPTDVSAIRLLAEIGIKVGQYPDARNLLERCLELAPDFHTARFNYAHVLLRMQDLEPALAELEKLLAGEPNNPSYLILKASVLVRKGDNAPALEIYQRIVKDYPQRGDAQISYGHTLKTVGRLEESVKAYRACIEMNPSGGEAWWSLANLKTFHFTDDDIAAMRAEVTTEGGNPEDQAHIGFALGKALEDRKEFDESFKFYKRGNAIRRISQRYDPTKNIYNSARQISTLNAGFLDSRKGYGCLAPDPIFIVGLPRAGSTLLEQILASHSQVEGTAELHDIIATSRRLGGRLRDNPASKYPEILNDLSADEFREMGEEYMETTRVQRGDEPYFIDKMPNNFLHIGLIHLILPNAKIIDARRHPMAGCFAGFKQLFASGQTFTYDLADIGHYYRDYVKMMDHWDNVLPGRVLLVQYEDMVADTEKQIRRVLEHCELPFEEQCLRFYETDRAVRTPSSEQVRQPIYTGALEQWRNYEAHLGPLKKALGPLLERYSID